MSQQILSPVTENSEQATAYVVDERMENGFTPQCSATTDSNCSAQVLPTEGRIGGVPTRLSNPNLKQWDGQPLKSGIVYQRNRLIDLPGLYIKENRNDTDRAAYWQKVGEDVGIIQPIKLAPARVAEASGFTLGYKDSQTREWHDATKAQRSDLLRYADKTKQDQNTVYYDGLLKEGFVSKAAQNYAYGKELKTKDIKDISSGKTISVDTELTNAMQRALAVYKKVLSGSVSAKILKGVPLAAWTRDKFRSATDKATMLEKICEKFENMRALQLTQLQEAKGVKGDKTQTTEIVLRRIFDEILGK